MCAWCRAPLVDEYGDPLWELFHDVAGGGLLFVCYESCQPRRLKPRAARLGRRQLVTAGGRRG